MGFSLEWKHGQPPVLLSNTGERICLVKVHDHVPMIASLVLTCPVNGRGGASSSSTDALPRAAGDREQEDCVTVEVGQLPANHFITHFPKNSFCDI